MSAFIIVTTSLGFVYLDLNHDLGCPGMWMGLLGAILVLGSAIECARMAAANAMPGVFLPAVIGSTGVVGAALVPLFWPLSGTPYPDDCMLGGLGWPLAASSISLLGCFVWQMPRYQVGTGQLQQAIIAGWIAVYFGTCFSFAVALRRIEPGDWGLYLIVGVIVVTKFADAGAYFTGRAIGRTKLCPTVSPGKTVEGLLGGAVVASLAAWIYFSIVGKTAFEELTVNVSPFGVILLGVLLTIAGVLGDLLESVFKREMGCKDSGRVLPGLGGLWDVTDSLLPAFVLAYLVMMAELITVS
ncbi:MAG TPA: hypothetical protein DDW52_21490 [Planctomycetaceae bacterium]|nr:hypothetical protein [Planctomycetaceae bacterium]